jgi:hypothetical protein
MDKTNMRHTLSYVGNVDNLKTMMNLLKDSSRSIQYEAFHVFKVGVLQGAGGQLVACRDRGGVGQGWGGQGAGGEARGGERRAGEVGGATGYAMLALLEQDPLSQG